MGESASYKEDTVDKIQYMKEFGVNIFAIKSLRRVTLKSNSRIAWKINEINERLIENYLIRTVETGECENVKINLKPLKSNIVNEPIWVMWYQGIEKAPDIVKCCVESIKEHSAGHQVIVLSEENLYDYIELPDFIMEKFSRGYISRTYLSDMIRLNLLYLYGGAWLDATVLVSNDIPEEYFREELFSLNFGKKTKDPSYGRWTTFCFFAKKGNSLIEKTLKYHYYYWMHKNHPIDYVMFDYFINYISRRDAVAAKQISEIKPTNENVFALMHSMNASYVNNSSLLIDTKTVFSKLSWKHEYVLEVNGKQTVYGYLVEKYLGK